MKIVKIDPRRVDQSLISQAAQTVRKGGVIVYPTDTVYGLGCDPYNVEAVLRIFKIKGREPKPMPVLASRIDIVEDVVVLNATARILIDQYWPGPLTLVLPRKPGCKLPLEVSAGQEYVGIRIPDHPVAISLIEASNGLLVGTSANKSGELSPRTAEEAIVQVGGEVDLIVDSGPTRYGVSSTVVKVEGSKITLIREGVISIEEINSII